MKRMIARFIACILLLSVSAAGAEGIRDWFGITSTGTPAAAAATPTPAPNDFRFRDGIRWGMNKSQVSALETVQMRDRSMQNWSIMLTNEKVNVSCFTADLVFMFREDRLMMISYEFQQGTQDSFRYLSGALSSLYGEMKEAEPLKIKALMDAIFPSRYRIELITQACGWTNSDGTTVYLYYYTATDFAIMYVSPELGARIYQTNGL
ncbi:MAG: hypothetical protein IKE15_07045 [Clostridia bacterium]|nr:hypothetical protein [Clostridia bacterium]